MFIDLENPEITDQFLLLFLEVRIAKLRRLRKTLNSLSSVSSLFIVERKMSRLLHPLHTHWRIVIALGLLNGGFPWYVSRRLSLTRHLRVSLVHRHHVLINNWLSVRVLA